MHRRLFIKRLSLGALGVAAAPGCLDCLWGPDDETDAPDLPVSIGFMTDSHYADKDPSGSRVYRDSIAKATDFIDECKAQGVDFVIETGDFTDQAPSEAATLLNLQAVETVIQGFGGPTYHTLGNHDMDNLSKLQVMSNVTNTGIDPAETYYSFNVKGVHFVILDPCFKSDGTEYDHGNYTWTDANIPQAELDWLAADLAAAPAPVVVFCHQLLDGDGTENVVVNNAPAVRTILENSGKVAAVLTGHHHPGEYKLINGIHYYTLKAMVENSYPSNNAFAVVDVMPGDAITITGYVNVTDSSLAI